MHGNMLVHDLLLQIMYGMGFPTDAIDAVKDLYIGATTQVKLGSEIHLRNFRNASPSQFECQIMPVSIREHEYPFLSKIVICLCVFYRLCLSLSRCLCHCVSLPSLAQSEPPSYQQVPNQVSSLSRQSKLE